MGCGKPTCFNFPPGATSHFNELEDGFFDGFTSVPKSIENSLNVSEKITCDKQFGETNCVGDDEWIGGIHPRSFNNERLIFRCCRNSVMKTAKFHEAIDLTTNDEFRSGGDVYAKGKLIGFDYISNIIKFETGQGTMYEVYVNRLFCNKLYASETLKQYQTRITNSESTFVETTQDENPATKYLNDPKPKVFQVPNIETQDVNNVNELQNINENNNIQSQEVGEVPEQANNNGAGAGPAGACSTCTGIQVITGTQLGMDLPITQTAEFDAAGCIVITLTCSSANPAEQIALNWALQGVNGGTTIGTGFVRETLSCNNAGQLVLNEQNAGIVDQAACVSRVPPPPPPPFQPLPPSSYYPVGNSGGFLNYLCFSADTLITKPDGTKKRMDDLKINEWVLSGNSENGHIGSTKVSSWIHRKPDLIAEFVKFSLSSGHQLKITKNHYIYKGDCKNNGTHGNIKNFKKTFAENVSLQDCLFFVNEKGELIETQIAKIELVQEKGIYAPLTDTGNIIVNDIFASCYSNVDEKHLQTSLPSFSGIVKDISTYFLSEHISSSSSSSSYEYDLIPGLKFFVNILTDILPQKL